MAPGMLAFNEALSLARRSLSVPHLLVGNGFSIGAYEGFGYDSLYEQVKGSLSLNAVKVFEEYGTTNFETIIQKLHEADWSAHLYGLYGQDEPHLIREDRDSVKDLLMSAIESVHPTMSTIGHRKLESAESFLRNFASVFSTCYDLLLYWVMNLHAPDQYRFQDGFIGSKTSYFSGRELPGLKFVYFLHGALHLVHKGEDVQKLVRGQSSIIEQVRELMSQGVDPLIITEGSSGEKIAGIQGNPYLSWVFKRLQDTAGSLFIYRNSLSASDEHIREVIVRNHALKSLYIGINPVENPRAISSLRAMADEIENGPTGASGRIVRFFDSSTAPVWGPVAS